MRRVAWAALLLPALMASIAVAQEPKSAEIRTAKAMTVEVEFAVDDDQAARLLDLLRRERVSIF